jgi:putative ABC transport system ATP-binding protein
VLSVENVSKSFAGPEGQIDVLSGVDLSLDAGEALALTGESGSGKSTLLALIGALDTPDSGVIRLHGAEITGLREADRAAIRRERVGLVFQQYNLIPSLDAGANLAFQARLAGRHDPDWTAEVTARLGLTGVLGRYPEELSGGQAQRVAIGRTLAARPALVLADEPTGNLDETTGERVLSLMLDLVADSGAALLMVTHSTVLAARLDRHVTLQRGRLV